MISESDSAAAETLEAAELGLDPHHPWPLHFTPAACWSPLVISFPHVGLEWPADAPRPRPAVDFARNADLDVDCLYPDAAALGAATVRARYSRLLIDLNRADDDVSAALVPDHPAPRPRQPPWASTGGRSPPVHNRGLIWRTAVGNVPIFSGPLPYAELQLRLRRYYDPYHRAVEVLLARRRARFGYAVLLEAHSMPSSVPGDLVLGTFEGGACSPELEARALAALAAAGPVGVSLAVRLNDPYRGGELVRKFGRPEHGIHALQLEVNRALYMDEASLSLRPEIPMSSLSSLVLHSSHPRGEPHAHGESQSRTASEIRPRIAAVGPASPGPGARLQPRPAAAPLALLYRVKSLVAALAAVTPRLAPATPSTDLPGASCPPVSPALFSPPR
jgi:N-formylglutamate deformylase